MASEARNSQGKRRSPKLRYLYLNGELHKVLNINRAKDVIMMWSYPQHKRVGYTYSDVKKRMKRAFTTREVSKMLMRHPIVFTRAWNRGDLERPQEAYSIANPDLAISKGFYWSEEDILAMHEVLSNAYQGTKHVQPPKRMPSRREVLAMIRHDAILYVRTDDGQFVPTWEAEQF